MTGAHDYMDWQNIVGTAAGVMALAFAAGIGGLRGSLANTRAHNEELSKRVDFLEKEVTRNENESAELRIQNAALTHDNDVLRSAVSGHTEFIALSDQLEDVARTLNRIDETLTDAFKELP